MFVRVAIPIPSHKSFIYGIPETLVQSVSVGKRVLVPFGKKRLTGWIIDILEEAACNQNIKEIIDIPDPETIFSQDDLTFYNWISHYYLYPIGKVLKEILPGGIDTKSDRWVRLVQHPAESKTGLTPGQNEIVECLATFPEGISLRGLTHTIGRNLYRDLRILETAGLLISDERMIRPAVLPKMQKWICLTHETSAGTKLTEKQKIFIKMLVEKGGLPVSGLEKRFRETAFHRSLESKGIVRVYLKEVARCPTSAPDIGGKTEKIILNESQEDALGKIRSCISSKKFCPCLLHGVTGSGKTEVYLRAVEDVLLNGGGVIYLVPEIALTAQLLSRVNKRFPEQEIAVIHSGVGQGVRYDQWRRIRRGELRLVVGARSALFAPVRNLRLIVVDEEHDPSYKQDDRMRYNARDLALVRGKMSGITVVLGSATPGISTRFQAAGGFYHYLKLPFRVDGRPLPAVDIIDMRIERDQNGRTPFLSGPLITAIGENLNRQKQTLLFLNRRGFHTFLFCPDCGYVLTCPSCDLALTFHAGQKILKCHHCDFTSKPQQFCPGCRNAHIRSQGAGTERIEDEVKRLFPEARVGRLDSDTVSANGNAAKILSKFDRRELDILVGTQMITKGHDFPDITLVGVLAADASLNVPDFRASERTFQLMTQVSGRGGRGDQPGRVLIQTFNPAHYVVQRAREHDYDGFYDAEIPLRRKLCFPPFSRLIGLHFSSLKKDEGKRTVSEIGNKARKLAASIACGKADVIGPAESPLSRLRGRYRWQMLLRGQESRLLHLLAEKLLEEAGHAMEIRVDVDPVHFM